MNFLFSINKMSSIFCVQSLSKEKERRDLNLNSFWMYSLKTNEWTCVYRCDHSIDQCMTKAQGIYSEPCPRYAHQLVYDWSTKVHYLFGGNPGKNTRPALRLDDFWILHLIRFFLSFSCKMCNNSSINIFPLSYAQTNSSANSATL